MQQKSRTKVSQAAHTPQLHAVHAFNAKHEDGFIWSTTENSTDVVFTGM